MGWKYSGKKYGKVKGFSKRFKRFFQHLSNFTNITEDDMEEIMYGANVEVYDGGRFYNLMCHDILLCERQRNSNLDCKECRHINKVYYEEASYGNGSSHKSWNDEDFPQYRLGKAGKKSVLPNMIGEGVSDKFDFIIGLREKDNKIWSWFQFEEAMGEDDLDSYDNVKQLDNETRAERTWKMSTLGHIWSTVKYAFTGRNQGPFGESDRNDSNPISLKIIRKKKEKHSYFKPINEKKDSVNATVVKKYCSPLFKLKF